LRGCGWRPEGAAAGPVDSNGGSQCADHAESAVIEDPIAAKQIETLRKNCADFGVTLYDVESPRQGIVHVIGPELGLTKPE